MPSHEHEPALEYQTEHDPQDLARTSPLHHPRRTAAQAPSSGAIQKQAVCASLASFGDAVNAGIHVQARGDLNGPDVHAQAAYGVSTNAASLPHVGAIQASFGKHDVSGVRAHVGGAAAEASAAIGAQAYATGNSVAFASDPDLHLAAHEAAHIVQQRGGVRLSDGVGRAGDEYERHADAVADLVVQGKSAEGLLDQYAHRGAAGGDAVQKQDTEETASDGPSEAEYCAAPDDSLNPHLAFEEMLALASERARTIGTPEPSDSLNECLMGIEALIEAGRSGSAGLFTETLEGSYFCDHDWRITASVERTEVADCGTVRGSGETGREGGTTRRSRGGETTDRDSTSGELTASRGHAAGDGGGRESSTGGTVGRESETTRMRSRGTEVESRGRGTTATVRTETSGRVYLYTVRWSIQTEISRTLDDAPTIYGNMFRGSFEPTPWGPVERTTAIGTRREDDTHAATSTERPRSRSRRAPEPPPPSRPERIVGHE